MRSTAKFSAAALTAGLGASVFMGVGPAMAAGPADSAAAGKAAAQPAAQKWLASFFVHQDQFKQGKLTKQTVTKAQADAKAPRLETGALPVYSLNPAFVKGTTSEVATFAYYAVGAKSATGQHATMWLSKSGKSWKVTNIASGSDEAVYPAKAAGGTVFTEPQIHAWYRLANGRVTGLNDTAVTSVGKSGVTLAAYQQLVRTRYADKLPGSQYQTSGKLGGYSPTTGVSKQSEGTGTAPVILALAGGGVIAAAGIAVARRKRVLG
ncbi:hypothetical protein [Actinomadura rubrisoli]|uniref:LPXTG cell wall anchor domain-containing protein n=1 Tax=Actinomadura rubrisoli TaxID=2530368 RepID=A0A4R5BI34_9ACTN|nr:hypothetical protein [Actinomadura rubrisoli]TDD83382.1 hypothetical protein E1298_21305 [Actinomadura rubrisoli]